MRLRGDALFCGLGKCLGTQLGDNRKDLSRKQDKGVNAALSMLSLTELPAKHSSRSFLIN